MDGVCVVGEDWQGGCGYVYVYIYIYAYIYIYIWGIPGRARALSARVSVRAILHGWGVRSGRGLAGRVWVCICVYIYICIYIYIYGVSRAERAHCLRV